VAAEHTLEYGELSDVGRRRASNQDSKAVAEPWSRDQFRRRGWLFLVADGMGAHAAGATASSLAAERVPQEYFSRPPSTSPPLALQASIERANATIFTQGSSADDLRGMGTTCTVLLILARGALVGHVGDSRCYRVRGGRIDQLSRDHSLAWELEEQGPPGMEEAVPKNIITRSMGPHPEVRVDVEGPFPVEDGDVFVLCSDGLSGQVADEEIGLLAGKLPPREATAALVGLSLVRGAPDNVTVVVARAGRKEATDTSPNDDPWLLTEAKSEPAGKRPLPWRWLAIAAASLLVELVALRFTGLMSPAGEPPPEPNVKAIALVTAVAALAGFVIGLAAAIFSTVDKGGGGERVLPPGKRLGGGPYRTYDCTVTEPLLEGIVASVETAADGLHDQDRVRLLDDVAAARAAIRSHDFSAAVPAAAAAIDRYRLAVEAARREGTAPS